MMQESPHALSTATVSSGGSVHGTPAATSQRQTVRGVKRANPVEVRDLLSRRRELTDLVADASRENDTLRTQVERSAAVLDAAGDSSDVSKTVRRHTENIRRLHEEMRTNKIRERSVERKLRKKEMALDKVKQEVRKTKELLENDDNLPQEDELYKKLARAANSLSAKDNLIQDLRTQIHSMTALHAAALDKKRLQRNEKKRETQRLFVHTEQLQHQTKMADRELAKGLIYSQKTLRLAHGIENPISTSAQSAPVLCCPPLNLQQKIKQFDANRREQWQEQVEKELKRKREAQERKRCREMEAERLRKLEEQRVMLEEQERERMRREVEKREEEKNRRAEELAEAIELQQQKLREETERLAREEDERQKKRCRQLLKQETDDMLKNKNRWYYEGGETDWQRSACDVASADVSQQTAWGDSSPFSTVQPVISANQKDNHDRQSRNDEYGPQRECYSSQRHTPRSPDGVRSRHTSPGAQTAAKPPKRHQIKAANKKYVSQPEVTTTSGKPRPDCV